MDLFQNQCCGKFMIYTIWTMNYLDMILGKKYWKYDDTEY